MQSYMPTADKNQSAEYSCDPWDHWRRPPLYYMENCCTRRDMILECSIILDVLCYWNVSLVVGATTNVFFDDELKNLPLFFTCLSYWFPCYSFTSVTKVMKFLVKTNCTSYIFHLGVTSSNIHNRLNGGCIYVNSFFVIFASRNSSCEIKHITFKCNLSLDYKKNDGIIIYIK